MAKKAKTNEELEQGILGLLEKGVPNDDHHLRNAIAKGVAGLVANPETDTSLTCGELARKAWKKRQRRRNTAASPDQTPECVVCGSTLVMPGFAVCAVCAEDF